MSVRPKIVIAGASGFIGSQLIKQLQSDYDLIGLTRSSRQNSPGLVWRNCDLYSLLQAERGLEGADYAFYLVHSMMPMARLTQGSFEDMDLILADNFARAAKLVGIEHIVYLGGIIPPSKNLSLHLHSRLEVEKTLASHGVPVTNVRASIIIGPRGSSFQIIKKLVQRLPLLLCPRWTLSETQPIALEDALTILGRVVGQTKYYHQSMDIGGPDIVNYIDLMRMTARCMGKKRWIISIPFISQRLSRYLVAFIASAPKELISPLIESLKDPMVAQNRTVQTELNVEGMPLKEAIEKALIQHEEMTTKGKPVKIPRQKYTRSLQVTDGFFLPESIRDVRSVQRLPLPRGKDAVWMAEKYTIWLPRFFKPWVRVTVDTERTIHFYFLGLNEPLLELSYSEERSTSDRTLFYITGGLLSSPRPGLRGRLEFREVLDSTCVLAAIHDFTPSLPWFIYNRTQALIHLWVMHSFSKYLERLDVRLY